MESFLRERMIFSAAHSGSHVDALSPLLSPTPIRADVLRQLGWHVAHRHHLAVSLGAPHRRGQGVWCVCCLMSREKGEREGLRGRALPP